MTNCTLKTVHVHTHTERERGAKKKRWKGRRKQLAERANESASKKPSNILPHIHKVVGKRAKTTRRRRKKKEKTALFREASEAIKRFEKALKSIVISHNVVSRAHVSTTVMFYFEVYCIRVVFKRLRKKKKEVERIKIQTIHNTLHEDQGLSETLDTQKGKKKKEN